MFVSGGSFSRSVVCYCNENVILAITLEESGCPEVLRQITTEVYVSRRKHRKSSRQLQFFLHCNLFIVKYN